MTRPIRLLMLVDDVQLAHELHRAMQNHVSLILPSIHFSPAECIHAGNYAAIVMTTDYAEKFAEDIANQASVSELPIERILVYQQDDWQKLSSLVEKGVVNRLIPHSWDIHTIVDLVMHLCSCLSTVIREKHFTDFLEVQSGADNDKLLKKVYELQEQNRRLQSLATTDGLTGLSNRRDLNDLMTQEIARSKRFGQSLSVVMCDVDYFKHYNDNFGHPAGDEVLKTVATIMRTRLRTSDHAARYGGEEFVLVLPVTAKDAAIRVADSIRKRIQEYHFPNEEKQPGGDLTISMGVATNGEDGETAQELIEAADKALYRAKQSGRNRVISFETGGELHPVLKELIA